MTIGSRKSRDDVAELEIGEDDLNIERKLIEVDPKVHFEQLQGEVLWLSMPQVPSVRGRYLEKRLAIVA